MRQRSTRGGSSTGVDNKTSQVCVLVARVLGSALASSFGNPLLHSLLVERVLPAPNIARLLVVVRSTAEDASVEQILEALDHVRGQLRSEIASELNRKRTPTLSFTVAAADVDVADEPAEPPAEAPAVADGAEPRVEPARPLPVQVPGARAPWTPKREHPRNAKRTLRREAKRAARRGQSILDGGPLPAQCEVTTEEGALPIKRWTRGVPVEEAALRQLSNVAKLPIVHKWVAAMPDVHWGIGATVGSVIPTVGAVIPAAVGVDIGCGMMAMRTTLTASDLPDNLAELRSSIERAVPHGRGKHGGRGDVGSWRDVPNPVAKVWQGLASGFERIAEKHPAVKQANHAIHLGTLGTGNHFIELCLDEADRVWVMLHSGSRGVGNRIGSYFIRLAQKDMERHLSRLPDKDLAYFSEGSDHFHDYVEAVEWAQTFARANRELMMNAVLSQLRQGPRLPPFQMDKQAINCHHNYVAREHHYGKDVLVTRKGAVRAGAGELGIIPGSMGARSYIVSGKGNPESFCSCSHGAGRKMSRAEAKRRFSIEDHVRMTAGVECRKDKAVIDETPAAYKDIDAVMAAQRDLVSIQHTLKQVLCVKG